MEIDAIFEDDADLDGVRAQKDGNGCGANTHDDNFEAGEAMDEDANPDAGDTGRLWTF